MPSFAFGSHHHLANPIDSPYSVEISADGDSSDLDSLSEVDLETGRLPELHSGCSCKGDLGVAHSKCAETWFKIKGNICIENLAVPMVSIILIVWTCEICGAMALNVAGEQSNPESTASANSQAAGGQQPQTQTEPLGIWHGRRVMNFLLAAMVFAFIVSWLFHFKVLK
ncbi:unnamed protein product [Arabis nemorensis]|uniref:RING-CH-type domain-containing protein n=1 Tax=Arabis nemorensis TaxID=586526 RepID=A0A565CSC6_9BRAS|nr:unnamed protein product [Arabis nemorensis]